MSFEDLDDDRPFEPDGDFRTSVRRRGRALHRRRRGIGTAVLASPLLVALVGLVWADRRLDDIDRVDLEVAGPPPGPGEPVDVLVVGTDGREAGPGGGGDGSSTPRADAIALVRLDASRGEVRVLPVPRDLLLPSDDGGGPSERTSQVRANGGPAGLVAGIERALTVDGVAPGIDHYVELDAAALAEVVDLAGGVAVTTDAPVRDLRSGARLDAGCQVVDGASFTALTRSRSLEAFDGTAWRDVTGGRGDLYRMAINEVLGEGLAVTVLAVEPDPAGLLALLGPIVEGTTLDEDLDVDRLLDWARWARSLPAADGPHGIVVSRLPSRAVTTPEGAVVLEPGFGWEDAVTAWSTGDSAPRSEPPGTGTEGITTESYVVGPGPGLPIATAPSCD